MIAGRCPAPCEENFLKEVLLDLSRTFDAENGVFGGHGL